MTTVQQGYGARYEKVKTNKLRSVSPSHYQHRINQDHSPNRPTNINHNHIQNRNYESTNTMGKVVSHLTDRVDNIEIKIVNLTNIIKLLQKYTQTKDTQYQKQRQNQQYRRIHQNMNIHKQILDKNLNIETESVQNKINEMQVVIKKAKNQITVMESLRMSIQKQRQSSKKTFCSPEPFQTIPKTIQSPPSGAIVLPQTTQNFNTKQLMEEIQDIMDRMQFNLREQMNKKIDICMQIFKHAENFGSKDDKQKCNKKDKNCNDSKYSSPSTVNALMLQEQLHTINLTINKVESDCNKNKMLIQNKIQQIVNFINKMRMKQSSNHSPYSKEFDNLSSNSRKRRKNNQQNEQNKSERSSVSKKSKLSSLSKKSKTKQKSKSNHELSKSNNKYVTKYNSDHSNREQKKTQTNRTKNDGNRLQQQKKIKQLQLKQVLRKKKQNQQKLKMKK